MISGRGRRAVAGVLVVGALGAMTATAAEAKRTSVRPRPDLVVSRGALKYDAGPGRLVGTVVVRNAGRRRAGATSMSIVVRFDGRDRSAGRVGVPALDARTSKSVRVSLRAPAGMRVPATARACADPRKLVRERAEGNNCRSLGAVVDASKPMPLPPPVVTTTPPPAPAPAPAVPASSVPTAPVPYTPDEVLELDGNWLVVPSSYDKTHRTPTELFVWLHGCGGQSSGDIYTVMPQPNGPYIALTVNGRENDCWDPGADQDRVRTAIAQAKTHFNIDPKRVVLGGYSSGGDLAYRLAFYHSLEFAGVLAENTSPFRDTGSSAAASIAAASWRFPVVHLAHTQDDTYDIDQVKGEIQSMKDAGFPVTLIERPGGHGDDTTDPDLQADLLPHLADGWRAP